MKIVLDNIKLADQRAGGVSAYWCELLKRFINDSLDFVVLEHQSACTTNVFRKLITIPTERIIVDKKIPVKMLRYLPIFKKFEKDTIFHSIYYRYATQSDVLNIITVYDFTYEYYRKGLPRFVHHLQKKNAIRHADGIICISNNTKADLLKYFPNIDESIITVIYMGISDDYQISKEWAKLPDTLSRILETKFILFVGDRDGYKNFRIAVDVVEQLKDYVLLCVGGPKISEQERVLLTSKLSDRFCHVSGINSTTLNILYNNAFCLIYPSSYEGFGIPVAEAMKAGCPVITTRTSSIPEVGGDSVLMVDDIVADHFIEKVKLLENNSVRLEFINKGLERAKRFSWETTYKETLEFYKYILSKNLN